MEKDEKLLENRIKML